MTISIATDDIQRLVKLTEDAHDMADAIDDLRDENPALGFMLLATLNAYLEYIQEQIVLMMGDAN